MLPYRQPVDAAQLGRSSRGGYLAAMGVDVIEVEGADGDPIRNSGTPNGYSFWICAGIEIYIEPEPLILCRRSSHAQSCCGTLHIRVAPEINPPPALTALRDRAKFTPLNKSRKM